MQFRGRDYNIRIWNMERLGNLIACDTETTITPFHMTPELVTMQAFDGKDTVYYIPKDKINLFFNMHYDSKLIFHNFAFDLDVLQRFLGRKEFSYDLIDRNRILDTSILYRLFHLASVGFIPFKYSLAEISKRFLGVELEKINDVRMNFAQFLSSKISEIPSNYLEYGALDVIATMQCYLILSGLIQSHDKYGTLLSHNIQVKGELALLHIYKNGIGFDLNKRDKWLKDIDAQMEIHTDILASWGWVRGKKGIKEDMNRILQFIGIFDKLPKTESGEVSTKTEDLEPYSKNPFIAAYLKYMELEKASSFVRDIDSSRIHPRYTSILNTGRTSCSGSGSGACNIQQIPKIGGIRELFVPAQGKLLVDIDYSALELATLSQVCLREIGFSKMGDMINEGKDLHKYYASVLYDKSEDAVTKEERQAAKPASFGFSGGLGINTFMTFAKGYGLELTTQEAQIMRDKWFQAFPEMSTYLSGEKGEVYTLTGRKRGNTSFCAEKNTPFQGLASDGLKLALYNIDKKGYKIVAEIHDQVVVEVDAHLANQALKDVSDIMISSMKHVVPDVKISVEGEIRERWGK